MEAVQADPTTLPGFEHRTFLCPACHDIERRLAYAGARTPGVEVIGRADVRRNDVHSQQLPRSLQLVPLRRSLGIDRVGKNPNRGRAGHDFPRKLHLCLAGNPAR
jgi:hypothetical protein